MQLSHSKKIDPFVLMTILVTTLGYFVDVYDIWVFAATRVTALKDLGVTPDKQMDTGILLLNLQMIGMLIGGVVFGIAGDKLGRTRVMFISILTYSLATLANAFVTNVESFAVFRFLSGFGLSGELGLGATLISEILSKEKRGLGVGFMVALGVTGALFAGVTAQLFDWRICYMIGGGMGLILLLFRMKIMESALFKNVEHNPNKGNIFLLFKTRERFMRFFWCMMLGLPTWFVLGILMTFSQEILPGAGLPIIATAILMVYCNIALPIGDFSSILLCQVLKKRRPVFALFVFISAVSSLSLLLLPRPLSELDVKLIYSVMAFGAGGWVLMTMISAESFGTNLRATVATAVPNFARASVVPMTMALGALKGHMPLLDAVIWVGAASFILPLIALSQLRETFGKSLEYLEEDKDNSKTN
jgi:MFS transporter, putative metabolite:H+ symporter